MITASLGGTPLAKPGAAAGCAARALRSPRADNSPTPPSRSKRFFGKKKSRVTDYRAFTKRFVVSPPTDVPAGAPLKGLRFAAKDNISVAGHGLTNGCKAWAERNPGTAARHAPCVADALAAGAELVGHTVMDQLAYSLQGDESDYPAPINPRNPDHLPGGSSSGSAVAVAAGEVDFALGTDTAGSVRVPAALCGLFGIRTSHGLVSTDGVVPLSESLDTVGWFARDASTLRRVGEALLTGRGAPPGDVPGRVYYAIDMFEYLSGNPGDASAMALGAFKACMDKTLRPDGSPVPIDMVDLPAFIQAHCPSLGRYLARLPDTVPRAVRVLGAVAEATRELQGFEIARRHGGLLGEAAGALRPAVAARLGAAAGLTAEDYAAAEEARGEFVRCMREALGAAPGSVLVVPTAPMPPVPVAPAGDELLGFRQRVFLLTSLAGLAGLPQVAVPIGEDSAGNAVSVSLVGPAGSDAFLLRVVERVHGRLAEAWELVGEHVRREAAKDEARAKDSADAAAREAAGREQALRHKERGNAAFRAQRFEQAVECYSRALECDPREATLYSNRAAALLKLLRFAEAEADCNRALEVGRDFNVKTLLRRGAAREGLQDLDGADRDYKHVLQQEPGNRDALAGRESVFNARRAAAIAQGAVRIPVGGGGGS